jgi:hypothetical protein
VEPTPGFEPGTFSLPKMCCIAKTAVEIKCSTYSDDL